MPLDHEAIAGFRRLIEHRRAELGRELREDVQRAGAETYGEIAGEVTDPGDRSVADVMADTRQAELSRDVDEMRALDAALERMLTGRFGRCVECDADIDVQRLRAEPAALRCIDCQRVRERTFAQPGHSSL